MTLNNIYRQFSVHFFRLVRQAAGGRCALALRRAAVGNANYEWIDVQ